MFGYRQKKIINSLQIQIQIPHLSKLTPCALLYNLLFYTHHSTSNSAYALKKLITTFGHPYSQLWH